MSAQQKRILSGGIKTVWQYPFLFPCICKKLPVAGSVNEGVSYMSYMIKLKAASSADRRRRGKGRSLKELSLWPYYTICSGIYLTAAQ